jgi:hypothetical protein
MLRKIMIVAVAMLASFGAARAGTPGDLDALTSAAFDAADSTTGYAEYLYQHPDEPCSLVAFEATGTPAYTDPLDDKVNGLDVADAGVGCVGTGHFVMTLEFQSWAAFHWGTYDSIQCDSADLESTSTVVACPGTHSYSPDAPEASKWHRVCFSLSIPDYPRQCSAPFPPSVRSR